MNILGKIKEMTDAFSMDSVLRAGQQSPSKINQPWALDNSATRATPSYGNQMNTGSFNLQGGQTNNTPSYGASQLLHDMPQGLGPVYNQPQTQIPRSMQKQINYSNRYNAYQPLSLEFEEEEYLPYR